MHVSSSTIAQAFAGYSGRASGSTATWRIQQDSGTGSAGSSGTCGGDSSQISSQGFAALLQDGDDQQPAFTDDQANQIGELIQQQDGSSFSKLDTDQDGKLSASELTAALNALQPAQQDASGGPPALTDEQAQKIGERIQQHDPDTFAKLDTDQDGSLSASEIDAGRKSGVLKPHHHGHGGGQPPALTDDQAKDFGTMLQQQDPDQFTALDTDQDGTLTASEVEAGRKSGALKPPPPPDAGGQGGQSGTGSGSANSGTSDYMANLIQDLLRNLGAATAA